MTGCTVSAFVLGIFFSTVLTAAPGSAQKVSEVVISVDLENATIPEVLAEIEAQTEYNFLYSRSVVESIGKLITLHHQAATVEEILIDISIQTGARFRQHGRTIATDFPTEVLGVPVVIEQDVVTGRIIDSVTREPVPGVNILVVGTTIGTTTDLNGVFELTVPSLNETLLISYIGYQRQELPIEGRSSIEVELVPQTIMGDELVVVAYGQAREAAITGSITSVNVDKVISSRPSTNVGSLLQGQVPGLFIHMDSGRPGEEGTNMLIRGVGTMGDSQPLVVIDGVESSMSDINPDDIQSISILKDASSAALYGTRAAHGVILIETKRGRRGPLQVNYNTYFGVQEPTTVLDFLPSADYARLYNEARKNAGLSPTFSEEVIAKYEAGNDPNYPSTDWMGLFYSENGFTQNHSLRVSGGSENTRYSISASFNQQNGIVKSVGSDRYNLRINLDNDISEIVKIGLNTSLNHRINTIPLTGPDLIRHGEIHQFYNSLIHIPPTQKVKLPDGSWSGEYPLGNPIAWIAAGNLRRDERTLFSGSVFGDLEIMNGLVLTGRASSDYGFTDIWRHTAEIYYGGGEYTGPPSNRKDLNKSINLNLEAFLNYENRFGNHGISGLLGVSRRSEEFETTMAYRIGFPANELTSLNAGSQDGLQNSGYSREVNLGSYFGRLSYDFQEKYLLEFTVRRDGSSKFARGHRWGWFPSVSVGWIVTNEEFLRSLDWLNFLRLRASWGALGNHRISDYIFLPRISLGQNYPFGGEVVPGAAQTSSNNEKITWEKTTETNVGLDFEILQNSLRFTVDAYNRYTDDILTTVPVSEMYGLPAPTVNAGAMSNKGVEVQVSWFQSLGDLQYDLTLNGSYNKNNTEKYHARSILTSTNPGGAMIRMEGLPWNSYFGYEWIGYFMTDEEAQNSAVHNPTVGAGDLKFKDQNGDGVIDGDDRIVLGNPVPEYTYGLNLGMNYKGFDLSMFFQGVQNVTRFVRTRGYMPFMRNGKALRMHLDRMIVEDGKVVKEGYFPKTQLEGGPGEKNVVSSSFLLHDGSYLRLKNLAIGYTLPTNVLNALSLSRARIYVSGQNLMTFTKFPDGYDPEASTQAFHGFQHGGAAGWDYPQVKIYTIGLDISF